jgi:hypothetical protein
MSSQTALCKALTALMPIKALPSATHPATHCSANYAKAFDVCHNASMSVVNTPYKQYTTAELAADYIRFNISCCACCVVSYYGSLIMLSNSASCTHQMLARVTNAHLLYHTCSTAHSVLPLLSMYAELCSLL